MTAREVGAVGESLRTLPRVKSRAKNVGIAAHQTPVASETEASEERL